MADRENDNEPEAKRLNQDDENDNVNDGNLSDHSSAANASDDDSDDGAASDLSVPSSVSSSDVSDDGNNQGGGGNNGNPPPRLKMEFRLLDSTIPIGHSVTGNILRVNIISARWADSPWDLTYHEDRIELVVEGIMTMTIISEEGNFNMSLIQVRKLDNGYEVEFPGPPGQ